MKPATTSACFQGELRRPADLQDEEAWTFIILPKTASDRFPRRGRTGVEGSINGRAFQAILEPDGQLSHWLKIPHTLLDSTTVAPGDLVILEVWPSAAQPEPQLPAAFRAALEASPEALKNWNNTTTIARIDWIHWVDSAKQEKTRLSRVADACQMLASGKKRVCCFDPSGFYSKSLGAPREAS